MYRPAISFSAVLISLCLAGGINKVFCQAVMQSITSKVGLIIQSDSDTCISVLKSDGKQLVLRQVAKPEERPYIHPIYSPDGQTVITEFRPGHHIHQTGLFWGLKRVNGRDYFMNGRGDYWKRKSLQVIKGSGKQVSWQTVYNLLDSTGHAIMEEEQNWTIEQIDNRYILDFKWTGKASVNVHIGKFYVGGLFVRMPWRKGTPAEAINASGLVDKQAEGQRSEWFDVGIQFKDPSNRIHFAILDHSSNKAFPTPWRIDGEFGFGPSRQIMEDWEIAGGQTETIRYRAIIYAGELDKDLIQKESLKYQTSFKPR